ncbi:MAG: HAD hydrolase family protein [Bacillota bacterium]|nr:HAD hydrolase family protein [Bacillota bacterium]
MKKSGIKLIALDLDDTTLTSAGTLAAETRAAIERAIKEGIEIVVASGRAFKALPEEVINIPGINYAVTSNGAAVNRLPSGERIKSYALPEKAVEEIMSIVEPYYEYVAVEAFIDGVPYSGRIHVEYPERFGCSKAYIGYIQSTRKPVEDIRGFIRENKGNIDSLDVACPDEEIRKKIRQNIISSVEGIHITSSVKHLTEIINSSAGKDSGLKYICEIKGISRDNTAAAGNADNDIAMIKFAGIGAAVSNSSPACLEAADMVIGCSNDHSVAGFINDICDGKIK